MMQKVMRILQAAGGAANRFYGRMFFRVKAKEASGSLKKKSMFCSAEAAAISVSVHLLLLLFAGSIVAVRYVQKHDAAFAGENIERPKLERRQLQMPVKVQNLQKKSRRPKVTTRMATPASSTFALPDMGLPKTGGFARTDMTDGGRDLSKMGGAGSLGFGISSVNFFGARSSGEKMIFVINASKFMLEDRKGGYMTYKFVKDRIAQMVSGMQAATLFNVVVYNERKEVALFRPKLVPASQEAKAQLLAWLNPINADPARVGQIPANYKPPVVYESDVADDARNWLLAVQAAMEQGADNIFVLCAGWERHDISAARKEKLFGWTAEDRKKRLEAAGWTETRLAALKIKQEENLAKGREMLAKENEARAAKGLPPKVIQDWTHYLYNELNFPKPEGPLSDAQQNSSMLAFYEITHVLSHLDAVFQYNYIPKKLEKPKIHFVCLIDEGGRSLSEGGLPMGSAGMVLLRKVADWSRGGFEYLRGAKKMENLLESNPGMLE